MHDISSDNVMVQVQLGPTITALIEVEGEIIEALATWYWSSDHNLIRNLNPFTVVGIKYFSEIPAECMWRTADEFHLEPSAVVLQSYGGDKFRVVRIIQN